MKNKTNLRCLILLLLGIVSINSCKRDSNIENPDEKLLTNAVSIENGYLKFRDQKAFDSLVNILVKPENFNAKPKELANFKSYRDIFLEIEKEYEKVNTSKAFGDFKNKYSDLVEIKSDSSLAYKFGTPLSALFTNANGEVKIGSVTTIYTKDQRMISYAGKHKNESQINSIYKTDASQGIFVGNISTKMTVATVEATFGPVVTSAIKSELYYNEDGQRRLFVDLWKDSAPRTDIEVWDPAALEYRIRYYFSSRQELKRTFGGWRTNETDYYFSNLNYNYSFTIFPNPNPTTFNYSLVSYSVGNATGPIIIDMGTKEGKPGGIFGTGRFFSGGVPNAPSFNVPN
ncbi:hypothetical protein [Pedobacter kyonggii]|uniref:DUF4848 domain-containing protein n=1 Tax=Pedobacter kyonggii TaxID=1926871 RepID=A0A4Q9H898_9SPHI|nr:hypothetical protein [Pedobacter kyonggii]TBO40082.1 hypothetical protein EYS08_20925 [Pedobacter kyonggii]